MRLLPHSARRLTSRRCQSVYDPLIDGDSVLPYDRPDLYPESLTARLVWVCSVFGSHLSYCDDGAPPYDVPAWGMLASIVVLYGTAAFFTWLSARIYRRGILMYGHKSTFADLWRWIK